MYRHCVTISFLSISFSIWERWSIISSGLLKVGESESGSIVSDSLQPHRLYNPWNSLGQNTGLDSLSLLQGIFPTQGLNLGLPHCRWILYQLSYLTVIHKNLRIFSRSPRKSVLSNPVLDPPESPY